MKKTITTEFFGIKLKAARKFKHMTQFDLGIKVEVSERTIAGYEQGRSYPPLETFIKICSVLDVSPDYLLSTSDNFPFKMWDLDEEQMDTVIEFIGLIELSNAISRKGEKLREE